RPHVKFFPALIPQSKIHLAVHFIGDDTRTVDVPPNTLSAYATSVPQQRSYEPTGPYKGSSSYTVTRPLGDLVFARSGDKGGNANVGFWVRDEKAWPWLCSFLTSAKLIELLGDDWVVERCEFSNLWAVHFVVKGILQEGVSSSSVLDGFAKGLGEFLRARHVELP
ncbi:hypothetical protein M434DRAFT_45659, partial [Hypoxylon sp. CO27-5]